MNLLLKYNGRQKYEILLHKKRKSSFVQLLFLQTFEKNTKIIKQHYY